MALPSLYQLHCPCGQSSQDFKAHLRVREFSVERVVYGILYVKVDLTWLNISTVFLYKNYFVIVNKIRLIRMSRTFYSRCVVHLSSVRKWSIMVTLVKGLEPYVSKIISKFFYPPNYAYASLSELSDLHNYVFIGKLRSSAFRAKIVF